jgi:hypothetical protein
VPELGDDSPHSLAETELSMARYARSAVFRTTVTSFLLMSALVAAGALPDSAIAGTGSCPRGQGAVIDVTYVVFHADGSSNDVSKLQRNVRLGDTVNALFNVPTLPAGCSQVELSLASYSSTGRPPGQRLFSSQTLEFVPGGRYEMSATIAPPPSPGAPRVYFRLVFASGPVLTRPHYGPDLIASARNAGRDGA